MTQLTLLGTGLMGAPMARNLVRAGHDLRVWNRTPDKARAIEGARAFDDPAEAVTGSAVVISMLADGPASAEIEDAAMAGFADGAIWVEMASIRPAEARAAGDRFAGRGMGYVDAPVSGGTRGAEDGTLAIMAGGDADVVARVVPVLEAMGRPVHVGPAGTGQLAKLANQAIVACTIGAVAEAMLLLEEGGADPAAVRDALKGGFADSTILQQHGARMTERDFRPGGPITHQIKDLDNVLDAAGALDLPAVRAVTERFRTLRDTMDGGALDHSALYLELRRRNGLGSIN
ncbi:NAD(P)-dependent oxidoreductase [uncultured Jannaschia sp.]|uniref:NAD(P)-dependent oxidoreductase n=1 Tax=uncultured Jannaschia sp. TaxID=293347 RepID=UPI00261EDDBC|nr:NAD(P)-dependent oxidoreductase [uncultured Jannaschia sp.]